MERNCAPDDKACFKDSFHMIPKWRLTVPVTVKYLISLDAPVTKWKMNYATVTPTATNYVLKGCSY